eukprot:2423075-Rhodomonas_salina.2
MLRWYRQHSTSICDAGTDSVVPAYAILVPIAWYQHVLCSYPSRGACIRYVITESVVPAYAPLVPDTAQCGNSICD